MRRATHPGRPLALQALETPAPPRTPRIHNPSLLLIDLHASRLLLGGISDLVSFGTLPSYLAMLGLRSLTQGRGEPLAQGSHLPCKLWAQRSLTQSRREAPAQGSLLPSRLWALTHRTPGIPNPILPLRLLLRGISDLVSSRLPQRGATSPGIPFAYT